MYIAAMVIPVPIARRDAYLAWAERSAAFFREYGCLEVVEAWEDSIPIGQLTDFRRAVAAEPGEAIVLTWQIWPDKAFLDDAEQRMHQDPRMEPDGDIPFEARRLILGCFSPIVVAGRAP